MRRTDAETAIAAAVEEAGAVPASSTNHEFSLVDEPWIPVLDVVGQRRDVSLLGLFEQANYIRTIACEPPTQAFAILRLALAILHRATGGPPGEAAWQRLWRSPGLPVADVAGYLAVHRDRLDLFHPAHPFYQVADLRAGNEKPFGLEKLIADAPNGTPLLTTRAGSGTDSITPAEAARWLVHCQAYDPPGIKTGAVGDPRVKGGRGYPMAPAPLGCLGGIHLEGADLGETLLLNLIPVAPGWAPDDDRDLPVWERPPLTEAEEAAATRGPFGLLGLYTWQARRIRLFGDRSGVTGAMISSGDPLDLQDMHLVEPMSVWGRSGPRERELKRVPVYLPRPHDPTRSLWRGLPALLPSPVAAGGEPPPWATPLVMSWLGQLTRNGVVSNHFRVRVRATGVAYGTEQAVIDEVIGDWLTMNVLLLADDPALRTAAVGAAADTDAAMNVLRTLAANLVRAAGGSPDRGGEAERATERGYALLDRAFRGWLAALGPDSHPDLARADWQGLLRRAIDRIGAELVASAGPAASSGRDIRDRSGHEVHYSSEQAEAWFRSGLARALPMASRERAA